MTAANLPALVETAPPGTPAAKVYGVPSPEQAEWFTRNAAALEAQAANVRALQQSMVAAMAEPAPPTRLSKLPQADLVLQFMLSMADSNLSETAILARARLLSQLYRNAYPPVGVSAPT